MSVYGKFMGTLAALAVAGGGAAYLAMSGGAAETVQTSAASSRCYVIKEHNGFVALFLEGTEQPIAVYNTPIADINPADAELLHDGIRLLGMSEVARLLEDLDVE